MWPTCKYACNMNKMIQIRNVPEPLHRKLKARAAEEGLSLSDLVLREMRCLAERPTLEEIKRRLAKLKPVPVDISPADAVRLERDSR